MRILCRVGSIHDGGSTVRLAQVEQPIVGVGDVFILNTHLGSSCKVMDVGKVPSHGDRKGLPCQRQTARLSQSRLRER